jgi:FixJ family two-component response regulator
LGGTSDRIALPQLDCRTYDDPLKLVADYRSQFAAGLRAAVCILDILMPQQSGFATARQLREIDPDIEIIVCTADPGTVPFAVSREFGNSVFFVRKPPNVASCGAARRCSAEGPNRCAGRPHSSAAFSPRSPISSS